MQEANTNKRITYIFSYGVKDSFLLSHHIHDSIEDKVMNIIFGMLIS